jgi:hypothetical protein
MEPPMANPSESPSHVKISYRAGSLNLFHDRTAGTRDSPKKTSENTLKNVGGICCGNVFLTMESARKTVITMGFWLTSGGVGVIGTNGI